MRFLQRQKNTGLAAAHFTFFIPPKPAIGNKKYCAPLNTFYGFQNFLMWRDKSAWESKADFP